MILVLQLQAVESSTLLFFNSIKYLSLQYNANNRLGLILRWSYGFNYLLVPQPGDDEDGSDRAEEDEEARLIDYGQVETGPRDSGVDTFAHSLDDNAMDGEAHNSQNTLNQQEAENLLTPQAGTHKRRQSKRSFVSSAHDSDFESGSSNEADNTKIAPRANGSLTMAPEASSLTSPNNPSVMSSFPSQQYDPPQTLQSEFRKRVNTIVNSFLGFMNPPLWAMVLAILVASIEPLQDLFYSPNSFVYHSLSKSIGILGNVAVPIILVILGANLVSAPAPPEGTSRLSRMRERKTIALALATRMLFVPLILCPASIILAIYGVEVGVLGDPVFLIVLWLLIGSPTAITITQICQLNEFCEREMASVLWWGYCVFSVPSTMFLVIESKYSATKSLNSTNRD